MKLSDYMNEDNMKMSEEQIDKHLEEIFGLTKEEAKEKKDTYQLEIINNMRNNLSKGSFKLSNESLVLLVALSVGLDDKYEEFVELLAEARISDYLNSLGTSPSKVHEGSEFDINEFYIREEPEDSVTSIILGSLLTNNEYSMLSVELEERVNSYIRNKDP